MYDEYEVAIGELKAKFGLQSDPFSSDLDTFYTGALRQHLLDNTKHLSIFGDMVLVLTGEHGSGKTTLLNALEKIAGDELDVLRLSANSQDGLSSIEQLAEISGVGFSPGEPERDILEHIIDQFAVAFAKHGRRTLIAIDDAQYLSDETLLEYVSIMSSLEPSSGTALLLAGPNSLYSRAAEYDHPDRNDWLFELALKPLSADEIADYLHARMEAAGFTGDRLIDLSVAETLFDKSRGIVADVNEYFLLHSLEVSYSVQNNSTQRSTQYVLFGIMGILLLSLVFVSYQHGLFDSGDIDQDERLLNVPLALEQKEESDADKVSRAERLKMLDAAIAKAEEEQAPSQHDTLTPVPPESVQQTGLIDSEVEKVVEPKDELPAVENSAIDTGSESNPEALAAELDSSNSVSAISSEATEIKADLSESDKPLVSEQELVSSPAPVAAAPESQPTADVAAPEKQLVEKKETPKVETGLKRSKTWLASQPTSAYTAQLLGSYNEQTAIKFTRKLQSQAIDAVYVESTYKGQLWFVVLYGVHETRTKANQAVASAPKAVKSIKPWVRSMAGVKASVGLE